MLGNVEKALSTIDKKMWTMDNNQRGYPLKYQRFRSSNTFVEVTVRTCVKGKICDNSIVDGHEK